MGVKISIPYPKQMCFVRYAPDKTIVGQASTFAEFQELVSSLHQEKLHYHADTDWYIATDYEDSVKFVCCFNDPAVAEDATNKVMNYNVYDRFGNIVGMCDNYDGFIACVLHVSPTHDVSCPHNADMSVFWCQDGWDNIQYYVKPNL